ncbi:MAG: NUDIX hydrolase [Candidatus Nomurabacteria bacterium GW2011_GWF2_43_8]|uniref:NUDIX hydrolase n=3 Tax=Candidatus Nomuraibacteriota TaxID=1752729 RepID=A0A0G1FIV1_9BACT|nr:MAG: NUDIX hydrolase [Candidatus Nomurabacteria bacterium GW2011_GWA2_43_15]KKT19852.1 MAG: NUDIX hydrolase [Candidatus Nomurabacteria bacterium GW2011_GWB1_43_7]KKT21938.1 MAG: NUDIX hydrolase [Candidatus Nomurabacteria bacterium GW2011_GWF2_43_8]
MGIKRPESKQPIPKNAKKVFKGVIFDVYQWEQEMFDGTKVVFEKAKRILDNVTIFAVLPDGKILLTEQEQPGKAPFIGGTGGRIDEGEDALTAARRELLEESGYIAEEFTLWFAQNSLPKVDWAVYVFIAKGLKKVSNLNLDAGEKVKLLPVTLDEFIDMPNHKDIYFAEQDVVFKLLEAKYDPRKRKELEELFKP